MPMYDVRSKKKSSRSRSRRRKSPGSTRLRRKSPRKFPKKSPKNSPRYGNYNKSQSKESFYSQQPVAQMSYGSSRNTDSKILTTAAFIAFAIILVKYLRDKNKSLKEELATLISVVKSTKKPDEIRDHVKTKAKQLLAVSTLVPAAVLYWYFPQNDFFQELQLVANKGVVTITDFLKSALSIQNKLNEDNSILTKLRAFKAKIDKDRIDKLKKDGILYMDYTP